MRIGNQSYCLIKSNGGYFLTDAHCPHMDYPLSDGKVNQNDELICMWHAYRFDLHSGHESQNRCRPMTTYRININEVGECWVDLN
jgi:nitrite reductase/ring-hydroxylating ferredoxin subunit